MNRPVLIGNAQGFWGDSLRAAAQLVSQQPDLDYLTLDYLAEVSLSIMAIQREKDPKFGYARDFVDVVSSLIPFWEKGFRVKVVTNAGGLNPMGCAQACAEVLKKTQAAHLKIACIYGDDVLEILLKDFANPLYKNLENQEPLQVVKSKLVTANAYFGAKGIAEALERGADIVITGRVADPSLTVGPCIKHFGWSFSDYHRLAGATVAGHLIECGTQVTGGISTNWLSIEDKVNIGFPIVEVDDQGNCVVTKPKGTGGIVNEETVKEQLLYEIGDPGNYLSPDVTVSFLTVRVKEEGSNRVRVFGATGRAPPSTLKVSATFRDGFRAEGHLTVIGNEAEKKAELCGNILIERVRLMGFPLKRTRVECVANGQQAALRVVAADANEKALEAFVQEFAPLVTSGAQGVTGYLSGRPKVRPVFGYWPCLIESSKVSVKIEMLENR